MKLEYNLPRKMERKFTRRAILKGAGMGLAGVGAMVLVGCNADSKENKASASTPTAEPEISPTVSPVEIKTPTNEVAPELSYQFDEGVTQADRDFAMNEVNLAREFYANKLGRDVRKNILVKVNNSDGRAAADDVRFILNLYTKSPTWKNVDSRATITIGHEFFHLIQADFGEKSTTSGKLGSSWVIEGTAEYAGSMFAVDRGLRSRDDLLKSNERIVRQSPPRPLSSAKIIVSAADYGLAVLAVDRLVGDRGIKLLGDFFSDASKMDWRSSFKKNFGTDVDTFVDDFEQWRINNHLSSSGK